MNVIFIINYINLIYYTEYPKINDDYFKRFFITF